MRVLKKRPGVRRAVVWIIILLTLFFFAVPDVAKIFWRTTTVFISIFSVEVAMVYLRKFIGVSSDATLALGLFWVNMAWIWWIFLFTGMRSFGGYVKGSSSRNVWVRRVRVYVKLLICYASEKSQSKHKFVRGMKRMVEACHENRLLLVPLFILAGIIPHADIAAIFVAVTFHFPIFFSMTLHRATIFQLPYLVLWTAFAMNAKILFIAWVLH